ncbi:MAG: hypothetical protein HY775_07995 [Acidobacteria bacterium]|nr:hypothetical protein [Acidobacteriota bacterium]
MGVRERVVREFVCDFCKKQIPVGQPAKVGRLDARTQGARGRGEQRELAFHTECYGTLVSSAARPGELRARRGRSAVAAKPPRKPRSAKSRAAKRGGRTKAKS